MLTTILNLLEVAAWSGIAALGFGILFNIPKSVIFTVFMLGFTAGLIKFSLMYFNVHIVLATFIAVFFVGIICMPVAHKIHHPPVVFCIPPTIPMIPGYFAYETVLSVMNFIFMEDDQAKRVELIDTIFTNGFTMIFILISIAAGISLPMLLLRKDSVKKIEE
ncbi:threonine/serine exporter family protein [Confluentibacter flavum]|uniref:Threonine/serine exporter n=1 Tax=Confluentibacter flavum TaxID=1909700 RepID=A0A2N3HMU9_9FLAO|nr:threonine/serine exporter family protein [Confluentibacter flavum]PKQ46300.1 threonine/serine exporter [Confluentibacter flavum]